MKIQNANTVSFKSTYDGKFVRNAKNFYIKNGLGVQYESLKKSLDKFETIGENKTHVGYKTMYPKGSDVKHILYLKNTDINSKEAYILAVTNKFSEIVKAFINLSEKDIVEGEKSLMKTQKKF